MGGGEDQNWAPVGDFVEVQAKMTKPCHEAAEEHVGEVRVGGVGLGYQGDVRQEGKNGVQDNALVSSVDDELCH